MTLAICSCSMTILTFHVSLSPSAPCIVYPNSTPLWSTLAPWPHALPPYNAPPYPRPLPPCPAVPQSPRAWPGGKIRPYLHVKGPTRALHQTLHESGGVLGSKMGRKVGALCDRFYFKNVPYCWVAGSLDMAISITRHVYFEVFWKSCSHSLILQCVLRYTLFFGYFDYFYCVFFHKILHCATRFMDPGPNGFKLVL